MLLASPVLAAPRSAADTSVVLVHGGFVDGSGWDAVYKLGSGPIDVRAAI
jgi:hypothetical protein